MTCCPVAVATTTGHDSFGTKRLIAHSGNAHLCACKRSLETSWNHPTCSPRAYENQSANVCHHGLAGVDFEFRKRWPPPLPCMALFANYFRGSVTPESNGLCSRQPNDSKRSSDPIMPSIPSATQSTAARMVFSVCRLNNRCFGSSPINQQ